MKRLLGLLLFTATAHAAPITPPAGWTLDATLAAPSAATRFAGATTKVAVFAYRAPAPGAVLYVNRAEAEVPAAERDRLATIELEEPRNALRRQGVNAKADQDSQRFDAAKKQLEAIVTWRDATIGVIELEEPRNALRRQGVNAKADQDSQRFDAAKKQLEASVTWRDATIGVIDSSRIVVAGDATKLVAVTAQCVLAADAPADTVKACDGALATLDTELPAEGRVALSIAASPEARAVTITATEIEAPPKRAHDVLDDGGKTALPPIVVSQPTTEPDRRPVYLGLGLVVLAAIFWWNRKRREKFEDDHPQEVPRDVPKATAKQKSRDEDADALHSAAEAGDDPENKQ